MSNSITKNNNIGYQLIPPDGGWGYVVAVSVTLLTVTVNLPLVAFGILFGNFLSSVGDETTAVAWANGLFNTVSSFMGLIVGALLNMYSQRQVALVGSFFIIIGATGLIFTYDLSLFLLFFGVLQGIGFGLVVPSIYSSIDSYFDKRLTVTMGISQAFLILCYVLSSPFIDFLIHNFGYRMTLMTYAVLCLFNFPLVYLLKPVKHHMKKVPIIEELRDIENNRKTKSLDHDTLNSQIEPLITEFLKNANDKTVHTNQHFQKNIAEKYASQKSINSSEIFSKHRKSIISIGDRMAHAASCHNVTGKTEEDDLQKDFWVTLKESFDFSLLKSFRYLNLSTGLALVFTAEISFIPMITLILKNIGFGTHIQTFMMSVYFGTDLVARILLSVVFYYFKIRSRYIFFGGTTLFAILIIAWISRDTYLWRLIILGSLGFLRCFFNTTIPLAISEAYPDQFANAFSLYLAICGVICLGIGPLMSTVQELTGDDNMVCLIFPVMFLTSSAAWTIEFIFFRKNMFTSKQEDP